MKIDYCISWPVGSLEGTDVVIVALCCKCGQGYQSELSSECVAGCCYMITKGPGRLEPPGAGNKGEKTTRNVCLSLSSPERARLCRPTSSTHTWPRSTCSGAQPSRRRGDRPSGLRWSRGGGGRLVVRHTLYLGRAWVSQPRLAGRVLDRAGGRALRIAACDLRVTE